MTPPYCYTIKFTDQQGEEFTFRAYGHEDHRLGMYLRNQTYSVVYLPDQPTVAKRMGDTRDASLSFFIGIAALVAAIAFHIGNRRNNRQISASRKLLEKLEEMAAEGKASEAVSMIAGAGKDIPKNALFGQLAAKLYEHGHHDESDAILTRTLDAYKQQKVSYKRDHALSMLAYHLNNAGDRIGTARVIALIKHKDAKTGLAFLLAAPRDHNKRQP
ncbi:hypothetical protein CAI21_16110 [Alkalilimnicola ehrlichii]|uniref:hypothetical protein n=1 Tax=Alkalilimnicola ehrlichii TaxID=351052 RepID=UPI000E2E91D3|nr:hypothetical protein [Alkalilimnicola ehrlichii]RFA26805.1 hypothetical protein CAI21_16110 [Alkalilimnicola ehrlichii]